MNTILNNVNRKGKYNTTLNHTSFSRKIDSLEIFVEKTLLPEWNETLSLISYVGKNYTSRRYK